jgi:glutathione peroxidase
MKYAILVALLVGVVFAAVFVRKVMGVTVVREPTDKPAGASVLDHVVTDIDGREYDLKQLKGKVVLIVNVASRCGFTPQYEGLEAIYDRYKDQGLVVIGFPANNFNGQEPGTNQDIKEFCTTKFDVSFPMMSKISVKGDDQHAVYRFLTSKETGGEFSGDIGWNFTKFLVDRHGNVIARFGSRVKPTDAELTAAVEKALAAGR